MKPDSRNFLTEVDRLSQKISPVNHLVNKLISLILPKTTAFAHVTCVPGGCTYLGDWDCGGTCFWSGSNPPACYLTNYVVRFYQCPGTGIKSCKECHSCDCGGCVIYHYGYC